MQHTHFYIYFYIYMKRLQTISQTIFVKNLTNAKKYVIILKLQRYALVRTY